MPMNAEAIVSFLAKMDKIRAEYGEDAYQDALRRFAKEAIRVGPPTDDLVRGFLIPAGIDWDALKAEVVAETATTEKAPPPGAPAAPDMGLFMRALQAQLPGLKSQAQFTAFQAAFEAFRATINGILTVNKDAEAAGKEALGQGFEAVRQATDITQKLEDVPEAATSEEAEAFKRPPAEFGEYDIQRALVTELGKVQTLSGLDDWWTMNRQRIDLVKTPSLRNPLIDLVREKKYRLGQGART